MYPNEFKRLCNTRLKYTDVDDVDFAATFVQLDVDNKGSLSLEQFQQWWKMHDQRHAALKSDNENEKPKIERIKKSFFLGTGGFGHMTPEQFRLKCYVSGYCLSDDELAEAFDKLDKDKSGTVDFIEYYRWRRQEDRFAYLQHDDEDDAVGAYVHQVADYFRIYDTELKGYLDREHFEPLYQHLLEHEQVDEPLASVMESVDLDNDGRISLNEFLRWYLKDVATDEQEVDSDDSSDLDVDTTTAPALHKAVSAEDACSTLAKSGPGGA